MRHSKKIIKLGRKYAHRKFMLANMASSLIEKKRINTTLTKAKALKNFFEPLVTKSKTDTTHNRRIVFRSLRNKEAVSELFRNISKKVGNRPGGYTRVVKLGNRLGDNASMAMIELVDYNQTYKLDKGEKKKSTRRGRRSKKKTDDIDKVNKIESVDNSINNEKNQVGSKKVEEKPIDQTEDNQDSKKVEEKPVDQTEDKQDSEKAEEKPVDQIQDQVKTDEKLIDASKEKPISNQKEKDSKDENSKEDE